MKQSAPALERALASEANQMGEMSMAEITPECDHVDLEHD